MKIGIVLLSGPYHHEAVDTVIHFTEAALQKGHTIGGIFLFMDGVYNINKYVKPTGERNVIEMLDSLGKKIPITACAACGQFRGMKREFSMHHMKVGGLGTLVNLAQTCDRVIMLGG
jgi:sulfur relay protein TusD/DsrE